MRASLNAVRRALSIVIALECAPLPARAGEPEPPAPPSSWELAGALGGGRGSSDTTHDWQLGGGAGATWYPHPILDESGPRTLAPYLQRLDSLSLALAATGSSSTGGASSISDRGVTLTLGGMLWFTKSLFISGSLGYSRSWYSGTLVVPISGMMVTTLDGGFHVLTPRLSFGGQFGTTRISGWYLHGFSRRTEVNESLSAGSGWGRAGIDLSSVVAESRLYLALGAYLQQYGGGGSLSAEYFLSRSTGIAAGLTVDRQSPTAGTSTTGIGVSLGIGHWVTPRLRVLVSATFGAALYEDQLVTPAPAYYRIDGLGGLLWRL